MPVVSSSVNGRSTIIRRCNACPKVYDPASFWYMYGAEDLGFHRMMCSPAGLGHIKDAVNIVKRNKRQSLDVQSVKIKEDPNVRAQLRSGHCIRLLLEHRVPAMRGLCTSSDVMTMCISWVASSIRPGGTDGMMREYIERFHHPEKRSSTHPVVVRKTSKRPMVSWYTRRMWWRSCITCRAGSRWKWCIAAHHDRKEKSRYLQKIAGKYFVNCKRRGYSDAHPGSMAADRKF